MSSQLRFCTHGFRTKRFKASRTSAALFDLVRDLERRRLAHGDLQHGNILIAESGIKLVNYDGMFVPAFAGADAPENGLACYEHPRRSPGDYGTGLDRFSALVIATALCTLWVDPGLWKDFNTGDNLLFTREDFEHPEDSRLFQRLTMLDDPQLRPWSAHSRPPARAARSTSRCRIVHCC